MIAPRKILAIKIRSLGDTLLMTAPLIELHRNYPHAEIHIVATQAWAPLLENVPGVKKIWSYERHPDAPSRAKAVAALAIKLRKEGFECAINFHASPSSATLAFASGAKIRSVHFHGHKDKNRFSTVEVPGKGVLKPIIERDMDAVRAIGIQIPQGKLPEIFLTPREKQEAFEDIMREGLTSPLLTLGIGSSRETKCWPLERFAQIANEWCRKTKGSVLALGDQNESQLCENFISQISPENKTRVSTKLGLPLRKLAALLHQSALLLGNDSGPRHIAVAVKTPTVSLFGPEDPFEWHPYPTDLHPYFFVQGLPCRKDADPGMPPWCGLHTCTIEQHACMKKIEVAEVLKECLKVAKK